jgi:Flp pilus assembly protein TadD
MSPLRNLVVAGLCLLSAPLFGEDPSPNPGTNAPSPLEPAPPSNPVPPAQAPGVPAGFLPLAHEAKRQFEAGDYAGAETTYRKILEAEPKNLYTLSNLGVVLFRASKFPQAEEMFQKAIVVAPEDGFSHCTLGIVYYSQGKFDDAVHELTKALAIDPKDTTAHNYLDVIAFQKGCAKRAGRMRRAMNSNWRSRSIRSMPTPNINLAVVLAIRTPPDKENAREHYTQALRLGAERDTALESLIK